MLGNLVIRRIEMLKLLSRQGLLVSDMEPMWYNILKFSLNALRNRFALRSVLYLVCWGDIVMIPG